jgi:hypothetical protein
MVSVDLMSNDLNVGEITPNCAVELDDTTFYPIAISHYWRDDITEIKMLELPTTTT